MSYTHDTLVWSNGMGTQSTAIALLIYRGLLPKPDRIVAADTGYEYSKSWEYTRQHIQPLMQEMGLTIEIAPHALSKVDMYSMKGELLIPAFDVATGSKLQTFCSSEWKKMVVRRHLGGYKAYKNGVTMWLGMSSDELGRVKPSDVKWVHHAYPLIELGMSRQDCIDFVLEEGLPLPIKSRCKMCPHQWDDEWIEIVKSGEEWEQAIEIDEQIFRSHNARLHRSCQPLSQVTFIPRGKDSKDPLFDCNSQACWS